MTLLNVLRHNPALRLLSPIILITVLSACRGGSDDDGGNNEPQNTAPVFTGSASVSVAENTTATGYVATATDADGNAVDFSLGGGADQSAFQIDSSSGALSFVTVPDYENPADNNRDNVYTVDIVATDGMTPATQNVAITVTNVADGDGSGNEPQNAAPVFTSGATAGVAENTTATGYIATATDADGDAVSFSLGGGADQSAFQIDGGSGALSFIAIPDYENPADSNGDNVYTVDIIATDGMTPATQSVAITVTNAADGSDGSGQSTGGTFTLSSDVRSHEGTVITLTISRTGATVGQASVRVSTTGGTATPLLDYVPLNGVLTWEDGDSAPKTVRLELLADSIDEFSAEAFSVELGDPSPTASLEASASASIGIGEGAVHRVASVAEFDVASTAAVPGDTIVLADGTYTFDTFVMDTAGADGMPLAFVAETPGMAVLTSNSAIRMRADYQLISGFKFEDNSARERLLLTGASNCRVVDIAVINSGSCTPTCGVGFFLLQNDSTYNTLERISFDGTTSIAVAIFGVDRGMNHHNIVRYSRFSDAVHIAGNGGEAIQVGQSQGTDAASHPDLQTVLEYNLFVNATSEPEVISAKASGTTIRNNVLVSSAGISLRQTTQSLVENNYLYDMKITVRTDGIIRGNYIVGAGVGIDVLAGETYYPVASPRWATDGALIEANAIRGSTSRDIYLARDFGNPSFPLVDTPPRDAVFTDNLILFTGGEGIVDRGSVNTTGTNNVINEEFSKVGNFAWLTSSPRADVVSAMEAFYQNLIVSQAELGHPCAVDYGQITLPDTYRRNLAGIGDGNTETAAFVTNLQARFLGPLWLRPDS